MICYSIQSRDQMFVKFWSFYTNMTKNIGNIKSKNVNSKYNQKCIDNAKQIFFRCT